MKKIVLFAFSAAFLTSCSLTEKYIADDVYVVKPSNLGVGESTADETTYAAFKQRKNGVSNDLQIWGDASNFGFDRSRSLGFGNHYGWFLYTSQFPYSDRRNFFRMGHESWMGFDSWDTHIMMMNRFGWNNGVWNGNSYGYNWYGSSNAWNCPQGGYGFGGNFLSNPYASNGYQGPRGSLSGFANPNGRRYNSVLKSGSTINGNLAMNGYGRTNRIQTGGVQTGRNSTLTVERKPIREIKNSHSVVRSNGTTRANGTSSSSRTYSRSDLGSRPTNSTYNSSGNSNSSGRNGTVQGSRSGSDSGVLNQGRSSSDNSSRSSSGSNGSSRSGGSTGGSTSGRRQ